MLPASDRTTSVATPEARSEFGGWLSGFSAGEASFILCWTRGRKTAKRKTGAAKFVIALRDDDREIIEEIQGFLGCGTIHGRIVEGTNPQCRLVVSRVEDLTKIVIPHFTRYRMRAKKKRDFPIWRDGVELIHRVASRPMTSPGVTRGFCTKWTDRDIAEFATIVEHLNRQREYTAVPVDLPRLDPVPVKPKGLFLFDLD